MTGFSWYERVAMAIFRFLAAQETLTRGTASDASTCSMMNNVYNEFWVWPLTDCTYFTKADEVWNYAAYGVDVPRELGECREMVQMDAQRVHNMSIAAEQCVRETYGGIFPYASRGKRSGACERLSGAWGGKEFSLEAVSEKLDRIRTFQRLTPKRGEARALGYSCNITDEFVANYTRAGKEIEKVLREIMDDARDDADLFVAWYQLG